MQDPGTEHNRSSLAIVAGLVTAASCAAALWWPRRDGAPTPAECLVGDGAQQARRLLLVLAGAAAGAFAAGWVGWRRRTVFATTMATAFAVGLPLLLGGWLPTAWTGSRLLAPALLAAALLSVLALAPCWRERTAWSLLWVPLLSFSPTLLGLRSQLLAAREAAPIGALLRLLESWSAIDGPVVLLLPADADPAAPLVLCRALQPPMRSEGLPVLCATVGSIEAQWLWRMGLPGLVARNGRFEPEPSPPPAARLVSQRRVVAEVVTSPPNIAVLLPPGLPRARAIAFTPVGPFPLAPDAAGDVSVLALAMPDRERFGAALGALPPGLPIRVLVVSPASDDAYGWVDLVP